jgi:hypothetical protein
MQDVELLWADFAIPIKTANDYINSLRGPPNERLFHGRACA